MSEVHIIIHQYNKAGNMFHTCTLATANGLSPRHVFLHNVTHVNESDDQHFN